MVVDNRCGYEQDYTCKEREVKGVYPTWDYKKYNLKELRDYVENPWSSSYDLSPDLQYFEKPKPDQPHKIFIRDCFTGIRMKEKMRIKHLAKIQRVYENVEFFLVPKSYGFGMMFGMGFTSSSFGAFHWVKSNNGMMVSPGGKKIPWRQIPEYKEVFENMGYDPAWVQEDRYHGIQYMIDAARWAAHHWDDPTGPYPRPRNYKTDYNVPEMYVPSLSYKSVPTFNREKIKPTDKILCNSCSLWRKCPAYRSGEVCNLSKSTTRKLAKLAGSRNAGDVVEMLSGIVEVQAGRAERLLEEEEVTNKSNSDVDTALNSLFKNGKQLALLLNPNLGRPLVQINNMNGIPHAQATQAINSADTRGLAAMVIKEIEATGVPREQITEQMVLDHIQDKYGQKAIEAEVVPNESLGT